MGGGAASTRIPPGRRGERDRSTAPGAANHRPCRPLACVPPGPGQSCMGRSLLPCHGPEQLQLHRDHDVSVTRPYRERARSRQSWRETLMSLGDERRRRRRVFCRTHGRSPPRSTAIHPDCAAATQAQVVSICAREERAMLGAACHLWALLAARHADDTQWSAFWGPRRRARNPGRRRLCGSEI